MVLRKTYRRVVPRYYSSEWPLCWVVDQPPVRCAKKMIHVGERCSESKTNGIGSMVERKNTQDERTECRDTIIAVPGELTLFMEQNATERGCQRHDHCGWVVDQAPVRCAKMEYCG